MTAIWQRKFKMWFSSFAEVLNFSNQNQFKHFQNKLSSNCCCSVEVKRDVLFTFQWQQFVCVCVCDFGQQCWLLVPEEEEEEEEEKVDPQWKEWRWLK